MCKGENIGQRFKKIIGVSAIVLIFSGVGVLTTMWESVYQMFVAFFPFIFDTGQMALEEYLTSPYFIEGVIMAIGSVFGIWFGKRSGKNLYVVVSIICETFSFISILANLFNVNRV